MVKHAVILAAGLGSRLSPLTYYRPKHILPLCGLPLIINQLLCLKEVGIRSIFIVKHYKGDMLKRVIEKFEDILKGLEICFVDQNETKGTAHALKVVDGYVNDEFLLIYGDITLTNCILYRFIKESKNGDDHGAAIAAVEVNDPWNYGVLKVKDGFLVGLVEKPRKGEEPSNLINAGLYYFKDTRVFEYVRKTKVNPIRGEYELTDTIQLMVNDGVKVKVVNCSRMKWWFDIGRPWDLIYANIEYLRRGYVKSEIKSTAKIHGKVLEPVYIGDNVVVEENAIVGPYTVLLDNVRVKAGSRISYSIILEGTSIGKECSIAYSVIGSNVTVHSGVKVYYSWSNHDEVWLRIKDNLMNSGYSKLGIVVGDYSEIGANTIFAPGVTVAPNSKIPDSTFLFTDFGFKHAL